MPGKAGTSTTASKAVSEDEELPGSQLLLSINVVWFGRKVDQPGAPLDLGPLGPWHLPAKNPRRRGKTPQEPAMKIESVRLELESKLEDDCEWFRYC